MAVVPCPELTQAAYDVKKIFLTPLSFLTPFLFEGGGGIRTHEITDLQSVALVHLATPPRFACQARRYGCINGALPGAHPSTAWPLADQGDTRNKQYSDPGRRGKPSADS